MILFFRPKRCCSCLDDIQMQEVKVQFERQRIAQESKKLALATLLRRLAIGSDNAEKFDEKLKDTIQKQKKKSGLPVVTGDMGDPNSMQPCFCLRIDLFLFLI